MSTIKMHTLARVAPDHGQRADLAAKRYDAIVWMLQHKNAEAMALYGGKAGVLAVLRAADTECDEFGALADGA